MGVPPVSELFVFGNVLPPDIEAAYIPYFAVDHHDLSVITVIDPQLKPPEKRREKFFYQNAAFPKIFPHPFRHKSAAHTVVEDPHFHSLANLFFQHRDHGFEYLVVFDDIILDVDVLPGFSHLLD